MNSDHNSFMYTFQPIGRLCVFWVAFGHPWVYVITFLWTVLSNGPCFSLLQRHLFRSMLGYVLGMPDRYVLLFPSMSELPTTCGRRDLFLDMRVFWCLHSSLWGSSSVRLYICLHTYLLVIPVPHIACTVIQAKPRLSSF